MRRGGRERERGEGAYLASRDLQANMDGRSRAVKRFGRA
jgi:hypothetical protein